MCYKIEIKSTMNPHTLEICEINISVAESNSRGINAKT